MQLGPPLCGGVAPCSKDPSVPVRDGDDGVVAFHLPASQRAEAAERGEDDACVDSLDVGPRRRCDIQLPVHFVLITAPVPRSEDLGPDAGFYVFARGEAFPRTSYFSR
ncbi:hypothetical protein GCM10010279_29790 [Streptomyces mutabilis]|nr:hypothetical protein GCM10010279_29790 [Streptomyces mutabilis]